MPSSTLTVTDNRTDRTYTLPIEDGTVRAMDFRQIKAGENDFGLMLYDPAFMNTASCRSSITFIDGERGILEYCGYPIEALAEHCTFLEVAYLILFGELPTAGELGRWVFEITHHTMLHETTKKFMEGFRYDAHPMSMLISTVAALASVYPGANEVHDPANRLLQIKRLVAKMPSIAALSYRHSLGFPYVYPDNDLSYTENFMNMLWRMVEPKYAANPVLARALEVLFILHADHEQNCSTSTMRAVGSALTNPYLCVASAASALAGPLHGGANEEVIRMLDEIGSVADVPAYIKNVKDGRGKLMGFGHRVYKNFDPRATLIKKIADDVLGVTGPNPKLGIALELERIALQDEYFITRKLYPNVDFYSGLIYQAIGFKPEMFTVLFAIPRTVGWLAQWQEMIVDPEQKIARPRQIYTGPRSRRVPLMAEREPAPVSA
ncbi:MAG: citrate synthase [Terracidiphilus sp.]